MEGKAGGTVEACYSGRMIANGSPYELDNSSGDLHLAVSATGADLSTIYFRDWENKCLSVYGSRALYEDHHILVQYHKAFQSRV